jgi:Xaa-Pro aminopeptidase
MFAHNVIAEAGYGENFGTASATGSCSTEAPRLARTAKDLLEDGMIVTVEPGIYLTGRFGVRIEDQCVIENGKVRAMSRAPKLMA